MADLLFVVRAAVPAPAAASEGAVSGGAPVASAHNDYEVLGAAVMASRQAWGLDCWRSGVRVPLKLTRIDPQQGSPFFLPSTGGGWLAHAGAEVE